ncbi:MAG: hypothetical protein KF809_15010 [Chloroflexi bacterium]|nr:hypothetical protein [Chloroflexota bacterium]
MIAWPAGTPGILATEHGPEPVAVLDFDGRNPSHPWLGAHNDGSPFQAAFDDIQLVGSGIRAAIEAAMLVMHQAREREAA